MVCMVQGPRACPNGPADRVVRISVVSARGIVPTACFFPLERARLMRISCFANLVFGESHIHLLSKLLVYLARAYVSRSLTL